MFCILLQAVTIRIVGATGNNSHSVNGYFELIPNEFHNFRPLYRKVDDPDIWLLMARNDKWYVTNTEDKESNVNRGWCSSVDHHVLTPDMVTGWKVSVNNKFTQQSSVSVVRFSPIRWAKQKVSSPFNDHRSIFLRRAIDCCICDECMIVVFCVCFMCRA